MSGITYIKIPIRLYTDKNLIEVKRAILGLAVAFGDKGLKISDGKLGAIFCKSRQWINTCIKELAADKYIRIEKPQSKYRVIYCQVEETVENSLLSSIVDSTVKCSPQSSQVALTHNIRREESNSGGSSFAFVVKGGGTYQLPQDKLVEYRQTYPALDVDAELHKAAQWLVDNPVKRRTKKETDKFIERWLGRAKSSQQGQKPLTPELEHQIFDQWESEHGPTGEEVDEIMREVDIL